MDARSGNRGRAHCSKCGRDVDTVFRNGREEYVMHPYVPDGDLSCHNSGQPVVPPTVRP
jgi:hypothetical protein